MEPLTGNNNESAEMKKTRDQFNQTANEIMADVRKAGVPGKAEIVERAIKSLAEGARAEKERSPDRGGKFMNGQKNVSNLKNLSDQNQNRVEELLELSKKFAGQM